MKRDFDFKTLFWLRLVAIIIPIFVTIPLAIWLRNYWALVIGNLAVNVANALFFSIKSNWKPRFFYSFSILRGMLSFCFWSLIDSILVWATSYADIFFIGKMLNSYYLGLYRTSIAIVGQIVSLITAIVLPVILPSLSRLQDNIPEMRKTLLSFQNITGLVLIPLGVGIFVFRDLITVVLLGDQWIEGADFLGLWGLMEAVTVVFARFCSPVYPAIGKPHISVVVQLMHLVVVIPAIIISGRYGFRTLYITRSFIRLEGALVNLVAVYIVIRQAPWKMIVNILPQFISSIIMAIVAYMLLAINNSIGFSFFCAILSVGVYLCSLYYFFPKKRGDMYNLLETVLKTIRIKRI